MDEENLEENQEIEEVNETAEETAVFEDRPDTILEKYTTRGWIRSFIFGIFLGLAVVVPGISGAAVAIIFKLYDKLIYSFANILRQFKACIAFLFPIIIGLIIGFLLGFFAVQYLINLVPFGMICYFAGLMIGALPSVFQEVKGVKINTNTVLLFTLGLIIPIIVGVVSILLDSDPTGAYGVQLGETDLSADGAIADSLFGDFPWWTYVAAIPIGFVLGLTQVLPGLSATAFLMMIGYFRPLVDTVHLSYFSEHPQIFAIYALMVVGLVAGFIITSKVLEKVFRWNRLLAYKVIVGMSVGSIVGMFLNPDSYGIYLSWASAFGSSNLMIVDISIAVPLLVFGFFCAFLLVKFGNRSAEKQA